MSKIFKIAIFVDSRKKSGGAYQELLYIIKNINKYNNKNIKFSIICLSKNLNLNLENENIELHYFSLSAFDRYICYLRNFNSFVRGIKKIFFLFFKNKFEVFLNKIEVDLVYFTGPSQYSLYLEDTKFFMTVPDVSHRENLEFPEIVNSLEFQRKDNILKKALPRALAVLTNCEIIKKRISFFYQVLEEKIFIVNHQPSNEIMNFNFADTALQNKIREKFNLPSKYIFYPAMYLPHKNHKNLIDALKILKTKYSIKLDVVFCGNDIGYLENIKRYTQEIDIANQIVFLDFVEDAYLPYLYLDASMLVMPSLIGPTNIPPWEAFKMNIPVIYSDLPGIKDVLGDAVLYINPMDPENISDTIIKITNDQELKNSLIKKGNIKFQENDARNDFLQIFKIIENFRENQKTWIFKKN